MNYRSIILILIVNINLIAQPTKNTSSLIKKPDSLKVVLIQFSDVQWNKYWVDSTTSWQNYRYLHKKSDFENLLASFQTYFGTNCDDDPVHGSFRDYFWEMSNHSYTPEVIILNKQNSDGYPIWIELANKKTYYNKFGPRNGFARFILDARKNTEEQLEIDISASDSVKICYIYAGNFCAGIDIATNFNEMAVPERNNGDRTPFEFENDKLAHIGYFCHEFGHMMGASHPDSSVGEWALMRAGHKNGDRHGNIPAPMSPWFLFQAGWADTIQIASYKSGIKLVYNTIVKKPNAYFVINQTSNKTILIENRQNSNLYDRRLPNARQNISGGILIWGIAGTGINRNNAISIIPSDKDKRPGIKNWAEDIFLPGQNQNTFITIKDDEKQFLPFAINNYNHCSDTITVDIYPNYWTGTIDKNTTWFTESSPYYIGGNLTIKSGTTLKIQSGAIIKFCGIYTITTEDKAQILAEGTNEAKIYFKSMNNVAQFAWQQLNLDSQNNCLKWCIFRNGIEFVNFDSSANVIENCKFIN